MASIQNHRGIFSYKIANFKTVHRDNWTRKSFEGFETEEPSIRLIKNPAIPNFLHALVGMNRMNKSSSTSVYIIALQEYLRPSDAIKIVASAEVID
ncbi:hypothetical protein CEXT_566911 [Caerostris extrusa]|uniref:Uncharacterized protein n=1 Tax=Caerostris extrusa TaxID=172846 RepID=A0AAV4SGJ6_CAEEX|nr:hypothetical protein CEXT_566911 [Caerostris extrusa]